MIITSIVAPYCLTLLYDPLGITTNYTDYMPNYFILYPMISGLHTFHLIKSYKNIKIDETIHHIVTYTFALINHIFNHPIYYSNLIFLSGIPGGITYALLFLQKIGKLNYSTEKKISVNINIWVRAPLSIIWSALIYCKYIYEYKTNFHLALTLISMFFITLNGIHFKNTIVESYYKHLFVKKIN